jgi:membrane-associated protein
MSLIFNFLLSYLLLYKYLTLFVVAVAAGIIVPLPLSALTLAVGAFSSQGYFSFILSLVAVAGGNIVGDAFDYYLAKKYGHAVVHRFKIDRSRFFIQLERYTREKAGWTIFITRFAGSLDPVVNFLSGLAEVPFLKFLFFDSLGNTLEIFFVLYVGYLAGNYWQNISGAIDIIGGIIIVAVIMYFLFKIYGRYSRKNPA